MSYVIDKKKTIREVMVLIAIKRGHVGRVYALI